MGLTFLLFALSCFMVDSANVVLDFTRKGLTEIPLASITSDATHIRIGYNAYGSIPNNTFAGLGLTLLYEFNVDSTGITDKGLSRNSFVGLENARVVSTFLCNEQQCLKHTCGGKINYESCKKSVVRTMSWVSWDIIKS